LSRIKAKRNSMGRPGRAGLCPVSNFVHMDVGKVRRRNGA
jgi:uncharacterized protein YcbK (DUF882 family)